MKQLIPLVALIASTACGFTHTSSALAPTAPATTAAPVSTPLVGQWSSQTATLPTASSCGNFQWTVTSQTSTSLSGTFSADCGGGVTISGTAAGDLTSATTVNINASGAATLPGIPSCAFFLSGVGTVQSNATALEVPYTGTTCLGPIHGTETLHKKSPPPPEPPAPPATAPTPSGPGDQIDLRSVVVQMGPSDIANWRVTSAVTGVDQGGGSLCIYHEQLGRWPTVPFFGDPGTPVEGNQWVFALINGQWYGGAADWYRPGQACKGVDASSIGRDAFHSDPMQSWVPRPGEVFGVMSSTPARAWPDMRTLDERTNVVLHTWQ